MTDLRRVLGCDVEFFKTWELQGRGALHLHSMMRATGIVSERRFRAAVRMCSRRWGFGDQYDVQAFSLGDAESAARKAGYVAKYASKSADDLHTVRRLDSATGEIRMGGLRPWSASRSWGDTMRTIKLRRCLWAAAHSRPGSGAPATVSGVGAAGALDSNQDFYALDPSSGAALAVSSSVIPV